MALHGEALLARLGVFRQRAVGEAEPGDRAVPVDDVDNAAGHEPAQSGGTRENGHHLARSNGRVRGRRLEPTEAKLIPALEGLDRGWYTGPVGWTDATGDGEFCVTLRCALLRGNVARCYAGNGIVRDSDPANELAETEIKLQALLPLLAG